MCVQPLTDDRVLDRHIRDVAVDGEGLVAAPGDGDVVEDHVLAVGNGDPVLTRVARLAHAEPHVADDGIVGVGPRQSVAIHCDAATRRRLAGDIHIFYNKPGVNDYGL